MCPFATIASTGLRLTPAEEGGGGGGGRLGGRLGGGLAFGRGGGGGGCDIALAVNICFLKKYID